MVFVAPCHLDSPSRAGLLRATRGDCAARVVGAYPQGVYRFALRPRWLLSHVAVAVLVVAMVLLGLWQLRRLDERRSANDLIERRSSQEVVGVTELIAANDGGAAADRHLYRQVIARGVYLADEEVLVRSRSLEGAPGSWVLTPLLLDSGTAVVVNRGWIPNDGSRDVAPPGAEPPEGDVAVRGLLYPSQQRSGLGPADPPDGQLATLARADLGRLQRQVEPDLLPAYVQLTDSEPAGGELPRALGPPEPSEGRHLGYAVQWFIFATIGLGGYPLILRRVARDKVDDRPDQRDELYPDDPRLDPVSGRDQGS
ncbi:SURF1 family protein [soil metagenome]